MVKVVDCQIQQPRHLSQKPPLGVPKTFLDPKGRSVWPGTHHRAASFRPSNSPSSIEGKSCFDLPQRLAEETFKRHCGLLPAYPSSSSHLFHSESSHSMQDRFPWVWEEKTSQEGKPWSLRSSSNKHFIYFRSTARFCNFQKMLFFCVRNVKTMTAAGRWPCDLNKREPERPLGANYNQLFSVILKSRSQSGWRGKKIVKKTNVRANVTSQKVASICKDLLHIHWTFSVFSVGRPDPESKSLKEQ